MTVVYFGPLTCSIITTTRKFFTILASVILFANPISPMQWVGTVLVFLGKLHPEHAALGHAKGLYFFSRNTYLYIFEMCYFRADFFKNEEEALPVIQPS